MLPKISDRTTILGCSYNIISGVHILSYNGNKHFVSTETCDEIESQYIPKPSVATRWTWFKISVCVHITTITILKPTMDSGSMATRTAYHATPLMHGFN